MDVEIVLREFLGSLSVLFDEDDVLGVVDEVVFVGDGDEFGGDSFIQVNNIFLIIIATISF
jgi:hypothetical protein